MSTDARPMRVLYLVSLFPCWSETFIVREIDELIRLGVDVRIVRIFLINTLVASIVFALVYGAIVYKIITPETFPW